MATHTQRPLPTLPGDRSLTDWYTEQDHLHMRLVRSRPTPELLRRIARCEAAIMRGGA